MFDFLRNLTKTEEEKQQERLSAYLDNALTPQERQAFEEQLRADTALQANLEQQRLVKQNVSQLPKVRSPRNFTLDPAAYGRPAPQTAFRLYPIMRGATVVAAVLLIFLFSLEFFSPLGEQAEILTGAQSVSTNVAMEEAAEPAAEEPAPAAPAEILSEEPSETVSDEEAAVEEEVAEEEAMEEAPMEEVVEEAELAPPTEQTAGEAAAGDATLPEATEQPFTEIEEEAAEGNGAIITSTQSPAPTTTLRLSPTATMEPGSDTEFFSETHNIQAIEPTAEVDADQSQPISTLNLLQIGLGILFLGLLVATLLLRRQL